LSSTQDAIKAAWTIGNVKEFTQVVGDVVWSDRKANGYVSLRGLPVNDTSKETYQLWIFDKTQDAATPIDGGTFDIKSGGEVVIPINAKLKAQGPQMFAITIEKPGRRRGFETRKDRGQLPRLKPLRAKTRRTV